MHLEYLLVIFALHLIPLGLLFIFLLRHAQERGLLLHVHPERLLSLIHDLPQPLTLLPHLLHAFGLLSRAQLVICTATSPLIGEGELLQVLQVVLPIGELVPDQGVHSPRLLVGQRALLAFGEAIAQGPKGLQGAIEMVSEFVLVVLLLFHLFNIINKMLKRYFS